jgi:hypothetical protein
MCISAGMMMAISTGVSVVGQLAQGQAAKAAANAEARNAENLAAQTRDAAMQEAKRIRTAGDKTRGAARAALAGSGIDVNSGSAITIEDEIATGSEMDAYNTLLTGQRKATSLTDSAAIARARGKNAVTSSLLGSVSTGLSGWKGVREAGPMSQPATYATPFRGVQ